MSVLDVVIAFDKARTRQRPYGLSEKQWRVACLLRQGLDCAEIARRLSTTRQSVAAQRGQIKRRLNAANLQHMDYILATIPSLRPRDAEVVDLDDLRIAFGDPDRPEADCDAKAQVLLRR